MRVHLLCHAATAATRTAAFAGDEPLENPGFPAAEVSLPWVDRVLRAPSTRCRQTAQALGLGPVAVPDVALAGCDFGGWTGRTLDQVLDADADGVQRWLGDPDATPHGGESITALVRRVGSWLDGLPTTSTARAVLVIADPTVIRAAVVHAIQAGPRTIWRIDVAPLSRTLLVGEPNRWSLRPGGR